MIPIAQARELVEAVFLYLLYRHSPHDTSSISYKWFELTEEEAHALIREACADCTFELRDAS